MPQIYVAVIAAFSALLVAVLSAIFQGRRERNLKRFEAELLRAEHERQEDAARRDAIRQACLESCRALQGFRDTLSLLAGSNHAMLSKVAKARLEAARDMVANSYKETFVLLSMDERRVIHSAKNRVFELCSILESLGVWNERNLVLTPEAVRLFEETRIILADAQQIVLIAALSPPQTALPDNKHG